MSPTPSERELERVRILNEKEILTSAEAAEFIGIPRRTLDDWRYRGVGPKGHKLGKHISYFREDLVTWVRDQQRV